MNKLVRVNRASIFVLGNPKTVHWSRVADTHLHNMDDVTLVRYEDFCEAKVGEIFRLARRVGLEPANDITDRVDRQHQRCGNRSVSFSDFFGPDNLAHIECICGDRMEKFGYEPREG